MKDLGNDEFEISSEEIVKVVTTGNKRPFLVAFQDPPAGSTWTNKKTNPNGEERQFKAPKPSGNIVSFDVEYDEQITANDPDPVARYRTVFTSISNPADPASTKKISVPKGAGPVPRFLKFTVK